MTRGRPPECEHFGESLTVNHILIECPETRNLRTSRQAARPAGSKLAKKAYKGLNSKNLRPVFQGIKQLSSVSKPGKNALLSVTANLWPDLNIKR